MPASPLPHCVHQPYLHHPISTRGQLDITRAMDIFVDLEQFAQLLVAPYGDRVLMQVANSDWKSNLSHHSQCPADRISMGSSRASTSLW